MIVFGCLCSRIPVHISRATVPDVRVFMNGNLEVEQAGCTASGGNSLRRTLVSAESVHAVRVSRIDKHEHTLPSSACGLSSWFRHCTEWNGSVGRSTVVFMSCCDQVLSSLDSIVSHAAVSYLVSICGGKHWSTLCPSLVASEEILCHPAHNVVRARSRTSIH